MAVYGKLRRHKQQSHSQLLLSPTKHASFGDQKLYTSSISSVSETDLFSSPSSLDPRTNTIMSDEMDGEQQKGLKVTDLAGPKKSVGFSIFNFEDLENEEPCFKRPKIRELAKNTEQLNDTGRTNLVQTVKKHGKPLKSSTTMIFPKTQEAGTDSGDETDSDELEVDVSTTIGRLNARLHELQTHVKAFKKDDDQLDACDSLSNPESVSIVSSLSKHYGQRRSFKLEEKNLSDDDEEAGDSGIEEDRSGISENGSSTRCQTLSELQLSGELQTFKLEFEMMLDQAERLVSSRKSQPEMLQFKLDFMVKINTNNKFRACSCTEMQAKRNTRIQAVFVELLKLEHKIPLLNLQLLRFLGNIELSLLEDNFHDWINEIQKEGNIPVIEYATELSRKSKNSMLKYTIIDWQDSFEDACITMFSSVLDVLLDLNRGQLIEVERKKSIISQLLIESLSCDGLFDKSLELVENIVLLSGADLVPISSKIADLLLQEQDMRQVNGLLKCCIKMVCDNDGKLATVHDCLINEKIWVKLWEFVSGSNIFREDFTDDHNEDETKAQTCLFSLGYLFGISTYADQIEFEVDTERLRTFLDSVNVRSVPDTLQSSCYGYLGCVAFRFLNKSGTLQSKDRRRISDLLSTYNNHPLAIDSLSKQINGILQNI